MKLFICSDVLGNLVVSRDLSCFFVSSETVSYPDGYWSNVRGHQEQSYFHQKILGNVLSSFTSCSFEQLFYRNRSLGSLSTSVSLLACHKGPRTVRYFGVIHEGTRDEVLKTSVLNREATKSHLDKDSSASLMHKNSNNLGSRSLILIVLTKNSQEQPPPPPPRPELNG